MTHAYLARRAFIDIGGADAESFLQNLITTDLSSLGADETAPGALLTPQGKILFFFLIARNSHGFRLETDSDNRDNLLKRLMIYRLRASVELSPANEEGVTVFWNDEATAGNRDLRFARAGTALYRRPGKHADGDNTSYDTLRTTCGIAEPPDDFALGDAFPHDVLMDLNGGLSFRKGCYVGQEVVSRMQHRSTARRRIVCVAAENTLPASGEALTAGGKTVGTLGTISGSKGLALVRIDKVGQAAASGIPVLAGNVPVTLTLPSWTGLTFPVEASGEEQ